MKEQTVKVLFECMNIIKGEYLHKSENYTKAEDKAINQYMEIEKNLPEDKRHLVKELDNAIDDLLGIRDDLIYGLGLKEGVSIREIEKEINKTLDNI